MAAPFFVSIVQTTTGGTKMSVLYTAEQVGKMLQLTDARVRFLVRTGRLKGINVGRNADGRPTYRIAESDLQEFLESRRTKEPVAATA